jgi:hypothetical protein
MPSPRAAFAIAPTAMAALAAVLFPRAPRAQRLPAAERLARCAFEARAFVVRPTVAFGEDPGFRLVVANRGNVPVRIAPDARGSSCVIAPYAVVLPTPEGNAHWPTDPVEVQDVPPGATRSIALRYLGGHRIRLAPGHYAVFVSYGTNAGVVDHGSERAVFVVEDHGSEAWAIEQAIRAGVGLENLTLQVRVAAEAHRAGEPSRLELWAENHGDAAVHLAELFLARWTAPNESLSQEHLWTADGALPVPPHARTRIHVWQHVFPPGTSELRVMYVGPRGLEDARLRVREGDRASGAGEAEVRGAPRGADPR